MTLTEFRRSVEGRTFPAGTQAFVDHNDLSVYLLTTWANGGVWFDEWIDSASPRWPKEYQWAVTDTRTLHRPKETRSVEPARWVEQLQEYIQEVLDKTK
jgi:hypothetical protein